jgi:hypothetical protein
VLILVKNFLVKRQCKTLLCCDAAANSFVAKARGAVFAHFHAVAVKWHISMRNWLLGLPWQIVHDQSPWCQRKVMSMLLTLLFTCLAFFFLDEFSLSVYSSYFLPRTLV